MTRKRRCPLCRVLLQPLDCRGVTIDAYLECCGLWFDARELERLLELSGPVFHASRLQYIEFEPSHCLCPGGHGAMRAQEIQPGGFVYDRCPTCGGL